MFSKNLKLLTIFVLLMCILHEVNGRRNILKSRRTLTRYYMKPTIIPGYAVVILVALGELIVGGLLYVLLRFACLETDWKPKYRRAPSTPSVSGEAPVPPTTTTSTP